MLSLAVDFYGVVVVMFLQLGCDFPDEGVVCGDRFGSEFHAAVCEAVSFLEVFEEAVEDFV